MTWKDRYYTQPEPDRTLRIMTPADIPSAVLIAQSIGWHHQPTDWERLFHWSPDGCFVVEESDRGIVGTVSTTSYGTALGWIGMLVVAPDRQSRGLGRQLMRAALDYLITRDTACIMLDATDAGRPLYESMGFRALYKVERWAGKASTYLGPRARPIKPGDVSDLLALDTRLFGVRRTHILLRLLEENPDLAWVDYHQGTLEGYLLGYRRPQTISLGPWMSWSAASAERLLLIALEQLQGQAVTLQIPDTNARALILAADHGFQRVTRCTRMVYGSASLPEVEPFAQLAIALMATG